jgi:hypothetical protein
LSGRDEGFVEMKSLMVDVTLCWTLGLDLSGDEDVTGEVMNGTVFKRESGYS